MNEDWLIGFTEGEGCFTYHSYKGGIRKNGTRTIYKFPSPTFQISQCDKEIIEKIKEYFKKTGINGSITKRPRIKKQHHQAYEFRVYGRKNNLKIFLFFKDKLITKNKKRQFETWGKRCDLYE